MVCLSEQKVDLLGTSPSTHGPLGDILHPDCRGEDRCQVGGAKGWRRAGSSLTERNAPRQPCLLTLDGSSPEVLDPWKPPSHSPHRIALHSLLGVPRWVCSFYRLPPLTLQGSRLSLSPSTLLIPRLHPSELKGPFSSPAACLGSC